MTKRKLSHKQIRRIRDLQESRKERAHKRQTAKAESISQDGLGPEQQGLVITNYGSTLAVECSQGKLWRCVPRQNLGLIVAGDRIVWQAAEDGSGVVSALHERATLLSRPDYTRRPKPVTANINQLYIVITSQPDFNEMMIDRYLVAAELEQIRPLLVLNKTDLMDEAEAAQVQARLDDYQRIGYQLILTSTKTDQGLTPLIDSMRDHTSILVGQSGVGKSSLINSLLPDRSIRIGELSETSGQGMHTTTSTTLYHLPNGGDLIDSPGVWEFGLHKIAEDLLAEGFIEFREHLGNCRFSDCKHLVEPDCAIRSALDEGQISRRRFDCFHQLREVTRPSD